MVVEERAAYEILTQADRFGGPTRMLKKRLFCVGFQSFNIWQLNTAPWVKTASAPIDMTMASALTIGYVACFDGKASLATHHTFPFKNQLQCRTSFWGYR